MVMVVYLMTYDTAGIAPGIPKVFLTGDAFNIYKTQDNGNTWDTVGFLADDHYSHGLQHIMQHHYHQQVIH